jgi:hypothetical protein
MYVDRDYSLETAAAIPNTHTYRTADYDHNGLRADGPAILTRLQSMTRTP